MKNVIHKYQIGDHVAWHGGVYRVVQVTSWVVGGDEGDDTYMLENGEEDDFAPMPLSHEWLSENDFARTEYVDTLRDVHHVAYSLVAGDNSVITLDYDTDSDACVFELYAPHVHVERDDMKYVHQLEHMLREYDINVELKF